MAMVGELATTGRNYYCGALGLQVGRGRKRGVGAASVFTAALSLLLSSAAAHTELGASPVCQALF